MAPRDAAPGTPRSLVAAAGLIAGVVAFGLARIALLPGLGFWDTGEFQTVGPVLGTAHPNGFPAYVILGWLTSIAFQPFGDPAFRMNLLSAVLVGGAAALTVVLVQQLSGRLLIALASGLITAAAPIVWNIGTHADVHALHVVLVALLFCLLVGWEQRVRRTAGAGHQFDSGDGVGRQPMSGDDGGPLESTTRASVGRPLGDPADRWLLAAAIVYGVGIANHSLMLLLAPGIGLFVLATQRDILRRPRFIAGLASALFLTALALYLELPLRAGLLRAPLVYGHPERLDGFLYVVLGQQFVGALYQPFTEFGSKIGDLARLGYDQLGLLAALVPVAFVVTAKRQPRYALLSGASFLITVLFNASYFNADISRYYLGPTVFAISWLALLAVEIVLLLVRLLGATDDQANSADAAGDTNRRPQLASTQRPSRPVPSGPAALILEIAVVAALLVPTVQALPARAQAADLTTQTYASQWAHQALDLMEPNAVVLSWWSYSTTLWYAQIVEGMRPDVWIIDDRTRLDEHLGEVNDVIDGQLGKRPVYAIRLAGDDDLIALQARYNLEELTMPTEQPMYRVLGLKVP